MTLEVTTSAPEEDVILYGGLEEGVSVVPFGPCGGTQLDLAFARQWQVLTTDEDGKGSITRNFRELWCGRYFQGLNHGCSTSNVVQVP